MSRISFSRKINVFFVGSILSLIFLLMLYVAFAQFLTDFVIGEMESNIILSIIILGLLLITFLSSMAVGFMAIKNIKKKSIIKASIMSTVLTLFSLILMSYISAFVLYPNIFINLVGLEIMIVFPQVIMYFGIYVLNHVFYLFILTTIIYHIFFVGFTEVFYEYAPKKFKLKKSNIKIKKIKFSKLSTAKNSMAIIYYAIMIGIAIFMIYYFTT